MFDVATTAATGCDELIDVNLPLQLSARRDPMSHLSNPHSVTLRRYASKPKSQQAPERVENTTLLVCPTLRPAHYIASRCQPIIATPLTGLQHILQTRHDSIGQLPSSQYLALMTRR